MSSKNLYFLRRGMDDKILRFLFSAIHLLLPVKLNGLTRVIADYIIPTAKQTRGGAAR